MLGLECNSYRQGCQYDLKWSSELQLNLGTQTLTKTHRIDFLALFNGRGKGFLIQDGKVANVMVE